MGLANDPGKVGGNKMRTILIGVLVGATTVAGAVPTFVNGNLKVGANAGATRFRNFGNGGGQGEQYLGIGSMGTNSGGSRIENNFTWSSPNTLDFSFKYDKVNDRLESWVQSQSTLVYNNFLSNVNTNSLTSTVKNLDWNVLQLSLKMVSTTGFTPTKFNLRGVQFNGSSLNMTDFFGVLGTNQDWTLTSYNFRDGFTLTGAIELDGGFGSSAELNTINFGFGNGPAAPPVPEPFTMALAGGALAAAVRRRRRK